MKNYMVADVFLSAEGVKRIEWAAREMPVLAAIREEFRRTKPLEGVRLGACLHVTTETANLMIALKDAGAEVALCASNPLSTQDDVAAALVEEYEIAVYAVHGEDRDTYYQAIHRTLDLKPNITMDDGADLISTVHKDRRDLIPGVSGGTEETTTGVVRLRAMEAAGELAYPVVAVNDARTKHLFDNRYGTGQSTIDGILRATNILLAGKTFVVLGYGWCGRGIAMRAHGMGARVTVTEVDAVKALEAAMDGFTVMPALEAAKVGDIFVTATGDTSVLTAAHFSVMKDGAIVANSGHFNVEIDVAYLDLQADSKRKIRANLDEYTMKGNRRIYLLGEGRLVNLAAAEGHPAAVMDMSFANQALCAEYIAAKHKELEKRVYPVPVDIDDRIALLKLKSMGMAKDELSEVQKQYMRSWEGGT